MNNTLTASKYGVAGIPLWWFTSYLTNRKQYCQVSSKKSNCSLWYYSGLSCLGPLLFVLHVNDFEQYLTKCTSHMCADDTSVTCSAEDIDELCTDLRVEVEHIAEWLPQNKLCLSTNKTEYMLVGHKRQTNHNIRPIEISINREPIK